MESGLYFVILHSLDWYNRFPSDRNQVVSEDHEQNCRENLLCILPFALQILLLQAYNLHVLQGRNLLLLSDQRIEKRLVVSLSLLMF